MALLLAKTLPMTRYLLLILLAGLLVAGCGGRREPEKSAATKKPKKPEPTKLDIKPVEVTADAFPSVDAALTELDRLLQLPDGNERRDGEARVQGWLVMQQDKAVPAVAAWAGDSQKPLPARITACRILSLLGPTGMDTLLQVASEGESVQLRRKAIQSLGMMKPEKKSVDKLIALLDDPDTQIKGQVIESLIRIGEPAKAASQKLNELRQTHAEEQIRVAAGQALKKVDPRKSFVD
jgi:HEAT repeat protein